MAPKRKCLKRKAKDGMNLRSGSNTGRQVAIEDAFSRVIPSRSPAKHGRKSRKCPFVDDEATVAREEDSNFVDDGATTTTSEQVIPQTDITRTSTSGGEMHCESHGQDARDTNIKHDHFFGQDVSLGLVSDVMSKFYVTRST